jgi:hypothetical protein
VILGTAAYMSPEQARGEAVDKRADVWAFGAVLYEMLTGERAFKGQTVTDILAAVVNTEPEWNKVPNKVQRLLRSCLKKDPEQRLRHIIDFELLLPEAAQVPLRSRRISWAVAFVAVLAVIALITLLRTSQPSGIAPTEVAFSVLPSSGIELGRVGSLSIDRISPDGSMILFRASDARFHIRKLSSLESDVLPQWPWRGDPFWAPDSQSIAFPTEINRLMKIRLPKGAQELVTENLFNNRGGSWGEKGIILVAQGDRGLYGVPAAGGTAQRLEIPGLKDGWYYGPDFLPGGDNFLVTFVPEGSVAAQVYLATLRDGKIVNPQALLANDTPAAFTPAGGGRILFVRNDNLYSQRLDLRARKLSGDPELLQEHVASYPPLRMAYFSVSRTGTFAWRPGTAVVSQVTVFDRVGNRVGIAGAPAPVVNLGLSPDESRLVASGPTGAWMLDASAPVRVSLNSRATYFVWSPDGSRVFFSTNRKLWELVVGGVTQAHELAEIPSADGKNPILIGISLDGRRALYRDDTTLSVLSFGGKGPPQRVIEQRSDNAAISPDGTWLVYTPRPEGGVYAQPVSGASLPRQITSRGWYPVWRADGKEILYHDGAKIWSVRVEGSGATLRFGKSEPLFSAASAMGLASAARPIAVNRDGSRIYFLQSAAQPESGVIQVRMHAIR